MRIAWMLWAAGIGLAIALVLAASKLQAEEKMRIHCDEQNCSVPRVMMLELIRDAQLAVEYAKMCNWGQK